MEGFCRGCLTRFDEPTDLLQYCESNRRLFVYSTGLQVKRNDTITFQLCKECFVNMKSASKFKKQCRNSDKKLKNYLTLREDGDTLDFGTYLKNGGDTLNLRLPFVSRSSTPRHQINQDDDNDSTCTSMHNFIADMLEGEEMPPAEDRIIREVIQEEADILDDTLDSQWLQEDMSIDDYRMDFNFAMSTPQSINNDHCYTPRRLHDEKEEVLHYYTSKNNIETCDEIKIGQQNDMPILESCGIKFDDNNMSVRNIVIGNLENEYCIKEPNTAETNDMPILDDCDIEFDGVIDGNITLGELETGHCVESIKEPDKKHLSIKEKLHNYDTFVQSKVTELISEEDPFVKLDSFKDNLFSVSNDISPFVNSEVVSANEDILHDIIAPLTNENEISVILSTGISNEKVIESPLTCELKYYMNKVEAVKTNDEKDIVGNKVLSNEKDICALLNQDLVDKSMSPPLTRELQQCINKATLQKAVNVESKLGDKELTIFKTGTVSTNDVQQTEKDICIVLNQVKRLEDVEDSPVQCELDRYMNKAKLKKKSKQILDSNIVNAERCSIDMNLELALRNDDSQEFSLDKLLVSPRVSLHSGASTPDIRNILFGDMTSKDKDSNIVSKFEDTVNIQENDSTDFIKEFMKDHSKHLSTPRQEFKDVTGTKQVTDEDMNITSKSVDTAKIDEVYSEFLKDDGQKPKPHNEMDKDTNVITNLEDIVKIPKINREDFIEGFLQNEDCKRRGKPMKGFCDEVTEAELKNSKSSPCGKGYFSVKDIRKMKELHKYNHEDMDEFESEQSDSLKDVDINVGEEIDDKTLLQKEVIEDLDISVTGLLDFDDNESVDLNFSISSDFLREENMDDEKEQTEDVFKRPFSPPDSKYDMDLCLCKICDKTFGSAKSLKIHFAKSHKLKLGRKRFVVLVPKICQFCGKSFRDNNNFNRHLKSHDEPDSFKCQYCFDKFPTRGRLSQHMRAHVNIVEKKENKQEEKNKKKFVCSTCGKGFAMKNNYSVHLRRHTKSYTVTCNICDQGFYRNVDLRIHMGVHSKEFTFPCEFCPKVYRTRSLLRGHMYRHLGIEDFDCEFCKVKFISKMLLQRHYKSKLCNKNREQQVEEANEALQGTQISIAERTRFSKMLEKIKEINENVTGSDKVLETNEKLKTQPSVTEKNSTETESLGSQEMAERGDVETLEKMETDTDIVLALDDIIYSKSESLIPDAMEESLYKL